MFSSTSSFLTNIAMQLIVYCYGEQTSVRLSVTLAKCAKSSSGYPGVINSLFERLFNLVLGYVSFGENESSRTPLNLRLNGDWLGSVSLLSRKPVESPWSQTGLGVSHTVRCHTDVKRCRKPGRKRVKFLF
jgi:hypothetical protein